MLFVGLLCSASVLVQPLLAAQVKPNFFSVLTFNLHLLVERNSYPTEAVNDLYSAPLIIDHVVQEIKTKRADVVLLQEVPTAAFSKSYRQRNPRAPLDLHLDMKNKLASHYRLVTCETSSTFLQNCVYVKNSANARALPGKRLGQKRSMAAAEITHACGAVVKVIATHVDRGTISDLANALGEGSIYQENIIVGADFNLSVQNIKSAGELSYFESANEITGTKPNVPHQLTMATSANFADGEEVDHILMSPAAQNSMVCVRLEYGTTLISDHLSVFANFVIKN